jgi:hypothetical protein
MANYLQMSKKQQVLALLELGWSHRRIQREIGVDRGTVATYDRARRANPAKPFPGSEGATPAKTGGDPSERSATPAKTFPGSGANPAKTFPGSPPRRRFEAAAYRTAIAEKLDAGLTVQRIWQDLVEEYGYGASYESVKRFVRTLAPKRRAVGVFHCAPGAEAPRWTGQMPQFVDGSNPAFFCGDRDLGVLLRRALRTQIRGDLRAPAARATFEDVRVM